MPPLPPPSDDQISVAIIALDESGDGWEKFAKSLPSMEQERTLRFHFAADRLRFAKCRHILRATLAPWLGCSPLEVTLRFGEHEKPHLDHETDLHFNLSHTRGGALIAFARGAEIGIDIENITRSSDLDGIARRVFTDRERSALDALKGDAKTSLFFRLWTAKEAFLKATGRGLSLDPASIETHLPNASARLGSFRCPREPAAERLQMRELDIGTPFAASLCAPTKMLTTAPLLTHEKSPPPSI